MHKRKIDMVEEIYVINVGGYIGFNTRSIRRLIEKISIFGKIDRAITRIVFIRGMQCRNILKTNLRRKKP